MDPSTLTAYTTARPDVQSMIVGQPRRILDVGCSDGTFGAALRTRFEPELIAGIEHDPDLARTARTRLDAVFEFDLNDFTTGSLPGDLDLVVFADVLEHTQDPARIVRMIMSCADDDCQVVISLPNVQHWTAIANLLRGRWPRRSRGLFDATHLRFFTWASIEELAEETGLIIEERRRNRRFLDHPGGGINRIARPILPWFPAQNFVTYQYIVRLRQAVSHP